MDIENTTAETSATLPEVTQPAGDGGAGGGTQGGGTAAGTTSAGTAGGTAAGTTSAGTAGAEVTSDDFDYDSLFEDDGDEDSDGDTDEGSDDGSDGETGSGEGETKGAAKVASKQSPETDAAFAQMRRRYEAQLAAQKAQTEDSVYASLNFKNPYTGEVIKTKAQYQAYEEAHAQALRAETAKKAGLSLDALDKIIAESPAVKQASEAAMRLEGEKKNAERAAAVERLKNEVGEISKYEVGVKTLEDVAKLDCYPKIYELTRKGVSLLDAYKLANIDSIAEKRAAAAKQKALNDTAGKEHLRRESTSRGNGAVTVPASVMALYRDLNPEVSDAEIIKHYQKYHK